MLLSFSIAIDFYKNDRETWYLLCVTKKNSERKVRLDAARYGSTLRVRSNPVILYYNRHVTSKRISLTVQQWGTKKENYITYKSFLVLYCYLHRFVNVIMNLAQYGLTCCELSRIDTTEGIIVWRTTTCHLTPWVIDEFVRRLCIFCGCTHLPLRTSRYWSNWNMFAVPSFQYNSCRTVSSIGRC